LRRSYRRAADRVGSCQIHRRARAVMPAPTPASTACAPMCSATASPNATRSPAPRARLAGYRTALADRKETPSDEPRNLRAPPR